MKHLQAEISFVPLSRGSCASARQGQGLAAASSFQDWMKAFIREQSETGLTIETAEELTKGETILFDLPVAGSTQARIIWNRNNIYGCEFLAPAGENAGGDAFQSPSVPPPAASGPGLEEMPVGKNASPDQLQSWISEFEKTNSISGQELAGFRQTSDGLIIALVARTN